MLQTSLKSQTTSGRGETIGEGGPPPRLTPSCLAFEVQVEGAYGHTKSSTTLIDATPHLQETAIGRMCGPDQTQQRPQSDPPVTPIGRSPPPNQTQLVRTLPTDLIALACCHFFVGALQRETLNSKATTLITSRAPPLYGDGLHLYCLLVQINTNKKRRMHKYINK